MLLVKNEIINSTLYDIWFDIFDNFITMYNTIVL